MKKLFALLLCLILGTFLALSGCSDPEEPAPAQIWTPETIRQKPVTSDDFLIGSWVSYARSSARKSAVDQTALLSDGGINFLIYASCVPSYGMLQEGESARLRNLSSLDWWKRINELMKANNIVYMFSSDAGLGGNDTENRVGWKDNAGQSGVDNAANIVPLLDNCIGYHLADEPSYDSLPTLAAVGKKYAQIKDGLTAFWNAHPGTSLAATGGDYEAYFKNYLDNVGSGNAQWISHDFYPFTRQYRQCARQLCHVFRHGYHAQDLPGIRRQGPRICSVLLLEERHLDHAQHRSDQVERKRIHDLWLSGDLLLQLCHVGL